MFIINRACYVEFTIPGTSVYITATKMIDINHLPDGMTIVVDDRRVVPGARLEWNKLLKKDGTPLKAAPAVVSLFKKLEADGWTVDREDFMKYHFPK